MSLLSIEEESLGYLFGRGAKEESIHELRCKTWRDFSDIQGIKLKGKIIDGWVIIPLYSPRGKLIGFEGRNTLEKGITQVRLQNSLWNPEWHGMRNSAMKKIWNGADIWVVEGIFDVFPLEWAIPDGDVVLGTVRARMSKKHIKFLQRFCEGWVHLVYDNDDAGKKAAHGWVDDTGKYRWGAAKKMKNNGIKYTIETYPLKDPGEIWLNFGVEGIKQYFSR